MEKRSDVLFSIMFLLSLVLGWSVVWMAGCDIIPAPEEVCVALDLPPECGEPPADPELCYTTVWLEFQGKLYWRVVNIPCQ